MATHLAQISALVGVLLPLLVAIIQQENWSAHVRTLIGVICIIVATTVTAWAEGKLNLHDWATSLITIFTLTQVSYHTLWKTTGVAPAIEHATSSGGGKV